MKSLIKLFVLIILAALFVFSLTAASCFGGDKNDSEGASDSIRTSGGGMSGTGTTSSSNTSAEVTISSSTASGVSGGTISSALVGKLYVSGIGNIMAIYTVTANTVTMNVVGGLATADYIISGTTLALTQRPNQGQGGFVSGTYYKPIN